MAAIQAVPEVARAHDRAQRLERGAAVSAALRQWQTIDGDLDAEFLRIAPALIEISNTAQARVAERATAYVPQILDATGQGTKTAPAFEIEPSRWVGTAGDGRHTETLLYGALIDAKEAISRGASYESAKRSGGEWLSRALGTLLSDTARGAVGAGMYARPVGGYVRMLTPPSCGRCVILAGKWFRKNAGFERHPGCDCIHIPASENLGGDMTTDPIEYLSGLSDDELVKVLGSKANARTWAEFGQDNPRQTLNQLVNAYRKSGGIRTAQLYGRTVKYTTEGITLRGVASAQMRRVRALSAAAKEGGRYRQVTAPRLMPESIFQIATDKAHAERLLRDHGWLGLAR